MSPPENMHGGRAAVSHCRGQAEGIITTLGEVMMDATDWSCPIGAARQTSSKMAQCVALQGYSIAQDRATLVSQIDRPLWYPLAV
jgi:hypothetical protein